MTLPRGLSSKIILPTLLVISMFSFPAFLAWQGMQGIQEKNESIRAYSRVLVDVHEMESGLQGEATAFSRMLESTDPAFSAKFLQAGDERELRFAELVQLASFQPELGWVEELEELDSRTQALTALGGIATIDPQMARAAVIEFESIQGRMHYLFSSLVESLESRSNATAVSSNDLAESTVQTVILTMVLTGMVGLGLAVLLARRITRPARALADAAHGLAAGRRVERVEISGNDELADLGLAFNQMASSLHLQTEALLKEQSKLRSVHQSITDGIIVFGNNGFIISANPAAEATLERTEAALAGSRTTGIPELDEVLGRSELVQTEDMVACWRHNDCQHKECPSYESEDLRCWLQCGTYCHDEIQDSFMQKRDACERCSVYQANGCATVDSESGGRSYSISVASILDDQGFQEGRLAVLHDMTEERHRSRQLVLLYEIANAIAMTGSIEESLRISLELCMGAMKATSGSILLLSDDGELHMAAHEGLPEEHVAGFNQILGEGIAGWVAQFGEAILLTEKDPDPIFTGVKQISDAVCIPIKDEKAVIGVLNLNERQEGDGFDHSSLDFLGPVALQIGMALSRARLHEKITREKEKSTAIVESMGESLCVRAPDRTILFANSAHKEIFGEECEGKHCYELYVGRVKVCRGCPLDRCFETGETVRRSHFVLDRLGIRRQLETTTSPLRDADGQISSCIEISRDVTEMLRIRNQAESRLHTLTRLFEVSNILSSSLELSMIVDDFTSSARKALHASSVSLMLFENDSHDLIIRSLAGASEDWQVQVGDTVDISAYHLNGLMSGVGPFSATSTGDMTQSTASMAPPGAQSILVGRLSSRGKLLGLIAVSSMRRGAFSEPGHLELFIDITNQAAVAVDNAEMYTRLEETFWSTIRSLAEAIDAKDSYTRGHSDRVAEYAEALTRKLGLEDEMLSAVRCAGYLHDIGKIGVPDAILLKPGKLDDDEYKQIMNHPILSHKIIEPVEFPYEVKPLVRHHHERIDGSGYPDRLVGDAIPLGARIIGIADAYEAMTSDRPYRKALSIDAALDELRRCSGTQFDSDLVDAFVEVIEENAVTIG
ncbi:MAG: HD domain-containing protein [Actinobacteria bacterium]|nr:HD domain-containing protein [Actinomycetota bacterium]